MRLINYNKKILLNYFNNKTMIILDQIILSGSNFIVSYLLARKLSSEEFGLYSLFIAILMFITSILNTLLFQPYQLYKHNNNNINKKNLLSITLLLIIISQIICIFYLLIVEDISIIYLIGFVGYMIFFILHEMNRKIFLEEESYKNLLSIDALGYIVRLFLLYLVLFKFKNNVIIFYSLGVSFFISFLFAKNYVPTKINIKDLKEYFYFGKWLLGSALIYWISTQLNIFLLAYETNVRDVGIFSALLIPFGLIRIIQTASESFLLSRLAKKYEDVKLEKKYLYDFFREVRFFYGIVFFIYIIIYLLDDFFLNIFYQKKFDEFILLFDMLILYSFFQSNIFFISIFFKVMNKSRELYFINRKVLLITFPIIVTFIHVYGLIGLANGLVFMSLFNFMFIVRRIFNV